MFSPQLPTASFIDVTSLCILIGRGPQTSTNALIGRKRNPPCFLHYSTSILRIFNNIIFYVASIPLITILILRICPSLTFLCLITGYARNVATFNSHQSASRPTTPFSRSFASF